MAAQFSGSRP
ncbi:putative Holliday junction resolvase, partial [Yersinia pestis PY-36]